MTVGFPGRFDQPDRYQGATVPLTPIIRVPRAPLVTDREYPLNQFWENVDKNATLPDAYGDLWYLAYFQSNGTFPADAIWIKAASAVSPPSGGIISLSDTLNTKTFSDGTGNIQLNSLSPGLTIVSDPPNNKIDFTLVGGGPFIDNILVQAATPPGVNPVVPDGTGQMRVAGNLVAAHSVPIETRTRNVNEWNIEPQISSAQAVSTLNANGMSHYNSANFTVDPNGFVSPSGTGLIQTLTPDEDFDGSPPTPIAPQGGTIIVSGATPAFATVTETYNSTGTATGNLKIEHRAWTTGFVVDPSTTPGTRGTFSTIQAAVTAAVAGQDVFIRANANPYVENITFKPGVNLIAFGCDAYNNVIISGNCTLSTAGTVACTGIVFRTNAANCITVSGSSASVLRLKGCNIQATNNTAISFTSSSASSEIDLTDCIGNIQTTGITLFSKSSAGGLTIFNSRFANSGGSTTASTSSAGTCNFQYTEFDFPITTSGTTIFGSKSNSFLTETQNVTALTFGGSGAHFCDLDYIASGTAVAISVGNNLTISGSVISSSNANPIGGAGTITYTGLSFQSSGNTINTTTINRLVFDGGQYKGRTNNTAPSAGMIGETISSVIASGSAVTLTPSGTAVNITSISLTAGIWDVNLLGQFSQTVSGTASSIAASISTTSATHGTSGNNRGDAPPPSFNVTAQTISIPQFRISLNATTTVYMVGSASFSSGTITGYGRISAVRVA